MSIRRFVPLAFTLLALLLFAARLRLLDNYLMDHDEVWSIWQSIGTPAEILRWTPYDWTPLHYQVQGVWQAAVGFQPVAARLASLFTLLIGAACVFRLARRLSGSPTSGLISVAAFGAFAINHHIGVVVRGYALLTALTAAALWLTLRYFHTPSWRRALPLGVVLAGMFYTHLVSLLPFILIGIFSLILQPRRLWHWWQPTLILSVLALPELFAKSEIIASGTRAQAVARLALPPLPEALGTLYADLFGAPFWLYAALCLLAAALLVRRLRLLLAVGALALTPLLAYFLNPLLGFFSARHLAWVMIGAALLLGVGLSVATTRLRGANVLIGTLLFAVLSFQMPDSRRYVIPTPNMLDSMPQLAVLLRGGDVVVRDPNLRGTLPEVWEYFSRVYFPNGLPLHPDGVGFRRVWYILTEGSETQPLFDNIREGRTVTRWFGTWDFMTRLYEAPPNPEGVPLGALTFHGATLQNAHTPDLGVFREGERLHLRVWWRGDSSSAPTWALGLHNAEGSLLQHTEMPPLPAPDAEGWIIADWHFTLPNSLETGAYALHLYADAIDAAHAVLFYVKAW